MHKTSVFLYTATINTNATEETSVDQAPTRNLIKDGPSLRNFIKPLNINIPIEKPIPYVQNICGDNQKGI